MQQTDVGEIYATDGYRWVRYTTEGHEWAHLCLKHVMELELSEDLIQMLIADF